MKTFKELNNLSGPNIRRGIVLLLSSCFFLGMIALTMHHHDAFFPLKDCAICKAKTTLSGTVNKIKADPPLSIASVSHRPEAIYRTSSRISFQYQTPFIASFLPNPFLNKAPPSIAWIHSIDQIQSNIWSDTKVTRKERISILSRHPGPALGADKLQAQLEGKMTNTDAESGSVISDAINLVKEYLLVLYKELKV